MEKNKETVFAERLKYAMQLRNMKAVRLCELTGISKSYISNYRYGYYKPSGANLAKLANALNVAPQWLDGYDVPMEPRLESNLAPASGPMRLINVLATISCGNGTYNDGEIVDTISLPSQMFNAGKEYFAMYADGDSMIGAGIDVGDLLIFERSNQPEQNKIGAFCIDNTTALCKRYKSSNGNIFLLSENDEYAPILVNPADECFRCVGILKKIVKSV